MSGGFTRPPVGVLGVCQNPDPVAPVRRVDGASRNNKRPAGVPDGFQVRAHRVEPQADVPSNIFKQTPSGSVVRNNAEHERPEVAVISRALALPGDAERLAGVTPGNKSCPRKLGGVEGCDVSPSSHVGPVPSQNFVAVVIDLHLPDACHARTGEPQREAADAGA